MKNELRAQARAPFEAHSGQSRKVGLEFEFPVVSRDGSAVEYAVMRDLFMHLKGLGYDLQHDARTGEVVSARTSAHGAEDSSGFHHDVLSLELGHCTLELSLAPDATLFAAQEHLTSVLEPILAFLRRHGVSLLGHGMQPLTPPSRALVTPKARYLEYEHDSGHRWIHPEVGADIHGFTVTASAQCHVDIDLSETVRAMNALNGLAGLQLALTANSSVWKGRVDPTCKAVRERMYDWVFKGAKAHPLPTTGLAPPIGSFDEYLQLIERLNVVLVEQAGHVVRPARVRTVQEYFDSSGAVELGEQGAVLTRRAPGFSDLAYFAGTLEFDARLSLEHGTIESRISCQQPPDALLVVPALVLGWIENLDEASLLAKELGPTLCSELRESAIDRGLAGEVQGLLVSELAETALEIAEEGLRRRDLGEEVFLTPLFERARARRGPADDSGDLFSAQGIQTWLEHFRLL